MSSYLVFSLKEKNTGEYRDVTSYVRGSNQFDIVTSSISMPRNNSYTKLTNNNVSLIRDEIKREREDLENRMEAYRQTNNPSWDLYTTAQDYIKMIKDIEALDMWCDNLNHIVDDIELSDGFYEGLYMYIDN